MLNKKWRQRIIDTDYINERAITATIVVNRQRFKLMSVYFPHSENADHQHRKNVQNDQEAHDKLQKITYLLLEETSMQNWDLVTELNA